MTNKIHKGIRNSLGDNVFLALVYLIVTASLLITFYPIYYVVIASISDPAYVNTGAFILYPKDISLAGYTGVLKMERIWIGYGNTIFYTFSGTLLGLACCLPAGYALSRNDLPFRNIIMGLMVFTMYFGGGMIPTYLVVKQLNLLNTRAILIIMGSVSVYNIILIRTFFSNTIPHELRESSLIDGCGNLRFFFAIVLPLSKAIIAVISLYLAVGYWNAYFNALLYIIDYSKYPLQVVLRELLMQRATELSGDASVAGESQKMLQVIKYSVIVVSTFPIMCIYPFLQKYFVKGVMIGSIKG